MATREQLESRLTELYNQAMKIAEERRSIEEELNHLANEEAIDNMSPNLKRQILEAAGVHSEEAFGNLGL